MNKPVVGIIEFNRPELTSRAIISAHTYAGMPHDVVVIVNSPTTAPLITKTAKKYAGELIVNRKNTGYTKAANTIIRMAGDEDVVLLNSDTWCEVDWLKHLHDAAHGDHKVKIGMACPQLVEKYGLHKNKPCGHAGSGCKNRTLERIFLFKGWFGFACAYLRRSMINEIGLMNEKHFNYGSDREYGMLAMNKGYWVVHTHHSVVHHIVQGSQIRERGWC
jgi:GT2 family glycosyltransferase